MVAMTPMDLGDARAQALAAVRKLAEAKDLGELMIVDVGVIETPEAWYFPYDSTAFVLRGDISSALAGNIPVRVARDGSGVRFEVPSTA
jgi:hypothetical protein